jgi:hypothetical protein
MKNVLMCTRVVRREWRDGIITRFFLQTTIGDAPACSSPMTRPGVSPATLCSVSQYLLAIIA